MLSQRKNIVPNTFSSLKRRKKPAKNELSQNSLSGGSSLGANIHLIRGKGSESKVKKKEEGETESPEDRLATVFQL